MLGSSASETQQREREEFEALLQARVIVRSPSILRLVRYIGDKYFAGEGDRVKEYNIAVEALGRSPDFDPKQDSIVRVEAHRLRRKLDEYYRTEGRNHTLRLTLDPGQYVPKFVPAESPDEVEAPPAHETLLEDPVITIAEPRSLRAETESPRRMRALPLILGALVLVLVAAAVHSTMRVKRDGALDSRPAIRIIAGAPGMEHMISTSALNWVGDRWFSGGAATVAAKAEVKTEDEPLHSQRAGDFNYAIPLPPGVYELRLYFAPRLKDPDTLAAEQSRRFAVYLNDTKIFDPLDPVNARPAGGKWLVRVFRDAAPARDGKLHLRFESGADPAYVSGIELTPGEKGRLEPIRIIARGAPVVDRTGRAWQPDRYVKGGTLTARTEPFPPGLDSNLFSGERYGAFSYQIPLARGRYTVRLYFAETWFTGSPLQLGSRRFDVYANGMPLLEDFDILREAGGSYRPLIEEFRGLRPDVEGYLRLNFVPRANFACLNALEIVDEGR